MFPINYLPLTVRHESIRTRSDNPDQMTLNKRSIVLYGHYLSVPKVTIKYKFDCNLYVQPKDKICLYYFDLTFYLWHILFKIFFTIFYLTNSQTRLSDPLYITTSFVSRPYLFLPSVFPCIRPLYNDPLSNATNDRVLWVKILHITTIRGLLSNRKLDNK